MKTKMLYFILFLNTGIYAQIYSNDTVTKIKDYQKYVHTAYNCIELIQKNDFKKLKEQFYSQNQDDENFNANAGKASTLLTKYGLPTEKSLLITKHKMKIEGKPHEYINIEYYFPVYYSDNKKNKTSILFLFEVCEIDGEKVLNMQIKEKKTDEELLKEFQEFVQKQK